MKTVQYPHGAKVVIPNMETGEAQVLTFTGSFDQRKLRKMLRKTLFINDKRSLMMIIEHFTVALRPVTQEEMISLLEAEADAEA